MHRSYEVLSLFQCCNYWFIFWNVFFFDKRSTFVVKHSSFSLRELFWTKSAIFSFSEIHKENKLSKNELLDCEGIWVSSSHMLECFYLPSGFCEYLSYISASLHQVSFSIIHRSTPMRADYIRSVVLSHLGIKEFRLCPKFKVMATHAAQLKPFSVRQHCWASCLKIDRAIRTTGGD